jgi:hypothetical protein
MLKEKSERGGEDEGDRENGKLFMKPSKLHGVTSQNTVMWTCRGHLAWCCVQRSLCVHFYVTLPLQTQVDNCNY